MGWGPAGRSGPPCNKASAAFPSPSPPPPPPHQSTTALRTGSWSPTRGSTSPSPLPAAVAKMLKPITGDFSGEEAGFQLFPQVQLHRLILFHGINELGAWCGNIRRAGRPDELFGEKWKLDAFARKKDEENTEVAARWGGRGTSLRRPGGRVASWCENLFCLPSEILLTP